MRDRNKLLQVAAENLLKKAELGKAIGLFEKLHPADAAEIIGDLPDDFQKMIFETWDIPRAADTFQEMDEQEQMDIVELLSTPLISDILEEMEADDVADLLGAIGKKDAHRILAAMDKEDAQEALRLMEHGEDTAGGIMTPEFVALRKDMTAQESIDLLRAEAPGAETIYYVFIVNRDDQLVGVISLRDLIIGQPSRLVEELMNPSVIYVDVDTDQEEVARIMSRYDLLALPVVDREHRLLGVVTIDDVVDVIEEEASEDIYRLGGVIREERLDSPAIESIKNRLPWMAFNLGTAFLAAGVVSLFQDSISRVVILAAFMPIVAGMGGNMGTQTLTVTTRGIALGQLEFREGIRVIARQVGIGITIGAVTGLLAGLVAYLARGNPYLGLVLFLAMTVNMGVAGLAGAGIPIVLRLLRQDPALGSGVIVTTFTDIFGFLAFLGLATTMLRFLI
ncbi:MAG: magnesium transporter [Candidatus Aquicultor primus]|uniref:Magnesium transporter MgtE n=1 Tax=Candidatus Aquicultor primus TaxID=1797195 RepID=A0A1F2UMQ0_9ACTN|nr:MAG: magnesium transporter [Candidatus Aquicultor primus]HCG99623.1 magnesium transporter [Actinomycetota bacterium]